MGLSTTTQFEINPMGASSDRDGSDQPWIDRKASQKATKASQARQASGRRRLVDPTTCDREYSKAELEFMRAMHDYKQQSGRMFPTWSEVLEVLKALGYTKDADAPVDNAEPTDLR